MFVLFSVSQLTPSYPPVYFHLCVWQFTAESLIKKKKTTKPLHCDSIETSCLYTVQELQVAAITACFICTTFMARPLINLNIFVNERMHNWWKQSFLIAAGLWNHLLEVIAIEGSRCIREISFHVTPVERGCLTQHTDMKWHVARRVDYFLFLNAEVLHALVAYSDILIFLTQTCSVFCNFKTPNYCCD